MFNATNRGDISYNICSCIIQFQVAYTGLLGLLAAPAL